jgi:hypothetical protein
MRGLELSPNVVLNVLNGINEARVGKLDGFGTTSDLVVHNDFSTLKNIKLLPLGEERLM